MAGATPPFHAGEVALAYNPVAMTATGGVQPYTWSVGAGALPDGLSLGSGGQVTGTPTRAGQFPFTVAVSDSGGSKASLNASVSIVPALTATFVRPCNAAGSCSVELGCVSVCYNFGSRSGGAAPYSYNATGHLPSGTSPSGLTLIGKFASTGTYNFTVTVTDGYGATASLRPTFTVLAHISLGAGPACSTSFYAFGCKTSLPYSGGSGGPKVRAVTASGTLCVAPNWTCNSTTNPPPGFTATAGNGVVSVSVPPPAAGSGFTYSGTVTLLLTDQSPCGPGSNCSSSGSVTVSIGGG